MSEDKTLSPFALLGIKEDASQSDLLAEALSGDSKSPAAHPSLSFGDAKDEAVNHIDELTKAIRKEPEQAADPDPKEDEPVEPQEPKQDEPEIPDYVHSLNQQQQAQMQRYDNLERVIRDQNAMIQRLSTTNPQQSQPSQPEDEWSQDPEVQKLRQSIEQQVMQRLWQQQAPMFHQMAADRYQVTTTRLGKDLEHFDKYFQPHELQTVFQNVVQKYGPQYAASVNWEQEWRNAYYVKDYQRLQGQMAKQEEKKLAESTKAKEQKQEQKAALKLVPKANQQGESGKRSRLSELDQLPVDPSFRNVSKELKRSFFGA